MKTITCKNYEVIIGEDNSLDLCSWFDNNNDNVITTLEIED